MFKGLMQYYKRLRRSGLLSKSTISLYIVNVIFQRVFRVSSRVDFQLHFTSNITAPSGLVIYGEGDNLLKCLALNGGVLIQASNGVSLHSDVLIAPGVKIISGNHDLCDFSAPCVPAEKINIMEGCWLGANSIILPGVTLEKGTVVGAGSVVTKSFGKGNIIVAGNPAKILRERK